jgi:hypothetical protein
VRKGRQVRLALEESDGRGVERFWSGSRRVSVQKTSALGIPGPVSRRPYDAGMPGVKSNLFG